MILSERMAELRKEKNLSQAELADALNVSRQSVSLLGERRGRSRLIFFWLYFALHFGVYTEFGTDPPVSLCNSRSRQSSASATTASLSSAPS